jgi:hypothetical protein
MHRCELRLEPPDVPRLSAVVVLFVVGLAGCAAGPAPMSGSPQPETAPYVGVFTGEFVDGKPLYRFPTIEVVGSRGRTTPGT